MDLKSLLAAAGLLVAPALAMAQAVVNVDNVGSRATVISAAGVHTACGLRFVGATTTDGSTFPVHTFDFNLTVAKDNGAFLALLKTQLSVVNTKEEFQAQKATLVPVSDTWIQVEGAAFMRPRARGLASEDKVSSLSAYEVDPVVEHLAALSSGKADKPMLLGITTAADKVARTYRIRPQVKKEDGDAFLACARSLFGVGGKPVQK